MDEVKKIITKRICEILCMLFLTILIILVVWIYTKLVSNYNEIVLLIITIVMLLWFLGIIIINKKYEFKEKELEFYENQLNSMENIEDKIELLKKII